MRKRDLGKKNSLKSKLDVHFNNYKRLRNDVTSTIRKGRIQYFKVKLANISGKSKRVLEACEINVTLKVCDG